MFENELFTVEEITSFKVFHEIFFYHIHGILSQKGIKFFARNSKKISIGLT
jgi:hypothetical protein